MSRTEPGEGKDPPTHPLAPGFCGHWLTRHSVTQMGPQLGGRKSRYPCAGLWSLLEALGKALLPDSFRLLAEVSSLWLQDCGPHSLLTDSAGSSLPLEAAHVPCHVFHVGPVSNSRSGTSHCPNRQLPLRLPPSPAGGSSLAHAHLAG